MVPVEEGTVANQFGPKYFRWRFDPDPPGITNWNMMRMGNLPHALLVAHDISQADHDALVLNADVYAFPENLDQPIADPTIDAFFEGLHLPTDWFTPSTTYRELLRSVAGMIQFNQRYKGIAAEATGELHSLFDNAGLDTRLREMTAQQEEWFYRAVESFGFNRSIVNRNMQLRQLVRQGASYWDDRTFVMGGFEF